MYTVYMTCMTCVTCVTCVTCMTCMMYYMMHMMYGPREKAQARAPQASWPRRDASHVTPRHITTRDVTGPGGG